MKKVAVLGSTGSIGTQTLDVIRCNSDKLKVHSLVAYSNESKLAEQTAEFCPDFCGLISRDPNCLLRAVEGADVAVVATRGIAAIPAILCCLDNGVDVALANKEALVCAGELIMSRVGKAKILPVDSEHCAIARCLQGNNKQVDKILLTASGGPFWNVPESELSKVNAEQALKHPNWHMGSKITVDSATMMNKALEVTEASFLFGIAVEKIQIVVHRQSVVHSMLQFSDGEVLAQLAVPDMRLPIQQALLGTDGNFVCKKLDFGDLLDLTFEPCDFDKFPCAQLGYKLASYPALCRTVMNAANDVCVDGFLQGRFSFDCFYNIIMKAVDFFCKRAERTELSVESVCSFDAETKLFVGELLKQC